MEVIENRSEIYPPHKKKKGSGSHAGNIDDARAERFQASLKMAISP
jgi:hypothetical protein